jgi:uncharacterized surface protein with fasciclin (FAS1) repeats
MKLRPASLAGLCAGSVLMAGVVSVSFAADPTSRLVADFDSNATTGQWVSVNDTVMGGVSDGSYRITERGTLQFFGDLSLDNNGGFTSIRSRNTDLGLDGYDVVAMRVKGDGRTYNVDLRTGSTPAAASYRATMETTAGEWREVRLPMSEFEYAVFGRRVIGADPITGDRVRSIGITLADKKPGPFQLEIDWIRGETRGPIIELASADDTASADGARDIVATAAAAGSFKTLLAAAEAAGLVGALQGEGPLTVFAPNDEAFAKLPAGTVESLLRPENREQLKAVLTYHVVSGEVILGGRTRETLQGASLGIEATGGFTVNGANVLAADIRTSNGVIHVIDRVLLPPQAVLSPAESAQAVLELAVQRGVPLFNAGQHEATVAIYEVAVESLLRSHDGVLSDDIRERLSEALQTVRTRGAGDPIGAAWTLRRAMDAAFLSLEDDA